MVEGLIPVLKSKITYESKIIMGIIAILVNLFCFILFVRVEGLVEFLILLIPPIFLIIPSETIKNSKILGSISLILVFMVLCSYLWTMTQGSMSAYDYYYYYYSYSHTYVYYCWVLCVFNTIVSLISASLLFIKTPKSNSRTSNNSQVFSNDIKYFCKFCGSKLEDNAVFCSKCGKKID